MLKNQSVVRFWKAVSLDHLISFFCCFYDASVQLGTTKFQSSIHCNPLQGQYRVEFTTQGKPCFHYREPLFSLQGPCIHHRESCIYYREFPVRITTQGNPCSHYREWVCSVFKGGHYLRKYGSFTKKHAGVGFRSKYAVKCSMFW